MIPDYKILNQSNDVIDVEIIFKSDLLYFNGHFDEAAILPAVAQTYIAQSIAETELIINDDFSSLKQVKFRHPIYPNSTVQLSLSYSREKMQLQFQYSQNKVIKALGKINYIAQMEDE